MTMPMVQVWPVRMGVHPLIVSMFMRMAHGVRQVPMVVIMVLVVMAMAVGVFDHGMAMRMRVGSAEQQTR